MTANKSAAEKLRELAADRDCYPDADELNLSFSAPFSGMKEMYALAKGIEYGTDVENARLKSAILAAADCIEQMDRRHMDFDCDACRANMRMDDEALAKLNEVLK